MDNFTKMLAGSLGLEEPWYVIGANFDEQAQEVHVYVGIREGAQFRCPNCGGATRRYGYEPRERVWRHGDCMFFPSFVHCRRPRIHCPNCGVKQINAPFERKGSRHTLLFEGYSMLILADTPRAKAAKILRCNEKTLASIMHHWVNDAVEKRSLDSVRKLAIDETSFQRGHIYVTVVVDAEKRCVIDVETGRDKEAVENFAVFLEDKGGKRNKIEAVSSDMSKSYVPAIAAAFPNAVHVIDKFHVKQVFQTALDDVRKQEQRQAESKKALFQGRRLFMVPQARLTNNQAEQIAYLSKLYPKTGRAYRIVAALDTMYASRTLQEAEAAFNALYSWMRRCRLGPMKRAAETLLRHKDKILAYFEQRITNAICEGINSMIQAAKRKARGFNTYMGFRAMIFLVAGKLRLAVPSPF